jgi:hypothetical protein
VIPVKIITIKPGGLQFAASATTRLIMRRFRKLDGKVESFMQNSGNPLIKLQLQSRSLSFNDLPQPDPNHKKAI